MRATRFTHRQLRYRASTPVVHRLGICLAVLVTAAAVTLSPTVAHADPSNPSDQQLSDAAAQKAALANQVGALTAQVAQMQAQVDLSNAQVEAAEQTLAFAISNYRDAQKAAAAAKKAISDAQAAVAQAQTTFATFVSASYMSGPTGGVAAGLLTAADPSQLLQRQDYLTFTAAHQLDALNKLNIASVAKSNAEAASRAAVLKEAATKQAAEQAQQAASAQLQNAQNQQAQLNANITSTQQQLDTAQSTLQNLVLQRAAYVAWQQQQAILAAQRLAARIAAAKAAAQAAAQAKAQLAAKASSGSSSSALTSTSANEGPLGAGISNAPSSSTFTAAIGATAVARAQQYLGWPYSWAGGDTTGPTYGVSDSGSAWNDGNIVGFDCSGLVMYAYAPYMTLPHYALSQYSVAGSYHPSVSNLMPGDLVFWSSNGAVSGIHHVAIYIGNGNVIQAPESGDVIKITPLSSVGSGYFGATRPLT